MKLLSTPKTGSLKYLGYITLVLLCGLEIYLIINALTEEWLNKMIGENFGTFLLAQLFMIINTGLGALFTRFYRMKIYVYITTVVSFVGAWYCFIKSVFPKESSPSIHDDFVFILGLVFFAVVAIIVCGICIKIADISTKR